MKKMLLGLSTSIVAAVGVANALPVVSSGKIAPIYEVEPRIVSIDDGNGVVPGSTNIFGQEITSIAGNTFTEGPHFVPTEYTGVGQLIIPTQQGTFACTGSRIGPTQILTAAHCITDFNGDVSIVGGDIRFINAAGDVQLFTLKQATQDNVHPNWNGNVGDGWDYAVLEMQTAPGADIETYGLYSEMDEFFQTYTRIGFGGLGTGNGGATGELGFKLKGQGLWEATYSIVDDVLSTISAPPTAAPETILLSDFDNGTSAANSFENKDLYLLSEGIVTENSGMFTDLGIPVLESNSAGGDSGGPGFIDGKIAGITSLGLAWGGFFGDIDGTLNSSFGEFAGDARVSMGLPFIESFLTPIPVPGAVWFFASALAGGGILRRRRA